MAASLDAIPHDVLGHIAYLLATASPTGPPRYLLPLLLTSSKIYRALVVHHCPQLYANIFRATFDIDHDLHTHLTDSILANELQLRHRILWRMRRNDLTSEPTIYEAWAALRTVLETSCRNEVLLAQAGLPAFIMTHVQNRLTRAAVDNPGSCQYSETMYILLWLLSVTLTHDNIVDTPEATREGLRKLLRFATFSPKMIGDSSQKAHGGKNVSGTIKPASHVSFADVDHTPLLEKATPIIIITFALNEAVPFKIPPHVPQTRAIAIANQRSGPTVEDFRDIANARTPLFAESRHAKFCSSNPAAYIANPAHREMYNARLRPFLHSTYLGLNYHPGYVYIPGSLAGLWEGSFMISGEPKPANALSPPVLGNFKCLKPMQCAITEYHCFSPHLPISWDHSADFLESVVKSPEFGYEKYIPGLNEGNRDFTKALDAIILGTTLHDHEQAWNGFRFVGRVRSDGFILMYREPKSQADREGLGTWIFEGHLRYHAAFVGQWRSSMPTSGCDLRGIFSLHKVDAAWSE
ncbi:hypothetical protein DXG03_005392 [Asterophora parasitica]|uniref:F-box domain-containing protein n=1 Tax=Asterophora parasitica TaxID=117018 RepID=A0A9P7FZX5_9AGAR|nr:hypothetical protein DXG03_005392 [Asterophora parasitica]